MARPVDDVSGGSSTTVNAGVKAKASGSLGFEPGGPTGKGVARSHNAGGGDGGGGNRRRRRGGKRKGGNKGRPGAGHGKDRLNPREIEREYGFAYKFFKSNHELWKLLNDAIDGNWSPERFRAKLQDTKWFQHHSDIFRQNYALKFSDKGTYHERLQNYKDQIQNLAGQYGLDLNHRELNRYADRAFMFGWSEAQILDHVAGEVRPTQRGHYGGELAGIEQQLRQVAFNNGVRIPQQQLTHWMRQIVRGSSDPKEYENYIRSIAAKTFEAYGHEIKSGMDVADVAAPYIQSMADILELNPAEVNAFDPTIRRALSFKNPKTHDPEPMSITDFEDALRADKRWQYTDQAHEQLKGYAEALGKMWGLL